MNERVAWADIGPPVKITMPAETAQAISGVEYAGVFDVHIGKPGQLTGFGVGGNGWTVVEAVFPTVATTADVGVLQIPFRAIPEDADQPIHLRFAIDGRKVVKSFRVGPKYFARRGKDSKAVIVRAGSKPESTDMESEVRSSGVGAVAGGAIPLHFTGRFVYTRSDSLVVGADRILVEVMDDDGLASDDLVDELIWWGYTDEYGYFDSGVIYWDDCDAVGCDDPDIYVRFECDTPVAQVQDSDIDEKDYAWSTMDGGIHEDFTGSAVDFGTISPADSAEMPAVHIWNSIVRVHRFIQDVTGIDSDHVDVQWPESETGAWYDSVFDEIHIGPDRQWNEATHTHEYGHHWLEIYSANEHDDYCNGICDTADDCGHCIWCQETMTDAWNEGWPNWLADVVTRDYPNRYINDDCTPYTALNLRDHETPAQCQMDNQFHAPWLTEGFTGALLRDIEDSIDDGYVDDPNDDDITDCMALGPAAIFDVVLTFHPTTLGEFINGFIPLFPQHIDTFWPTAFNVDPSFVTGFPADTQPPGVVSQMDSPSHPMGTGGSSACMTVEWTRAPDDVSGVCGYSVAWSTDPAGAEPDTVIDSGDPTGSCTSSTTIGPFPLGSYYVSIRAMDCMNNWSPQWATFGPFEVIDCNGNGVPDACDIDCSPTSPPGCTIGSSFCDGYATCDTTNDCNNNRVPDECDMASGQFEDCNANGRPDECDVADQILLHWVGGHGSWFNPANWHKPGTCSQTDLCDQSELVCNDVPVDGDDVCIDVDADVTVSYMNETTRIGALSCAESLSVGGGSFPWADLVLEQASHVDGDLTLAGVLASLTVNETLQVGGMLTWTGSATLTGDGATELNGGMEITGGAVQLNGHHLFLGSSSTAVSHGRMDFPGVSQFRIRSGATYNHQSDFDVFAGGNDDVFENYGTFIKSVGSGTGAINIHTLNSGLIHVQSGTLRLTGGSESTGDFLADSGTTLTFQGGGHELLSGSSIVAENVHFDTGIAGVSNVRGTYNVSGTTTNNNQEVTFTNEANVISYGSDFLIPQGTVNFNAVVGGPIAFDTLVLGTPIALAGHANFNSGDPVFVQNLSVGPGTVNGPSTIFVNGELTWKASGHFFGPGIINVNGDMTIESGGGAKSLSNRVLNNSGTAVILGTIGMQAGSALNNLPGGSIDIQTDGTLFTLGTDSVISNSGYLIKSAGPGTSVVDVNTINDGTIEVQIGTLEFGGGFGLLAHVQTDGIAKLNGGDLSYGSGTTFDMQGGLLTGIGTVHGTVLNVGGDLSPGLSAGLLTIDGDYTQGAGARCVTEIGGLAPGVDYDQCQVTGTATLDGELHIEVLPGFDPQIGQAFILLTAGVRSGVFATISNRLIGTGRRFDPQYDATSLTLIVVAAIAGDGDFTGDGLATDADVFHFTNCLTGPNVPALPGCEPADMDGDGDVDLNDKSIFQTSFGV